MDIALAVNGHAQGIDDPAQQGLAHWHFDDAVGALYLVAFVDQGVLAEEHTADVVFFEVEGHAHNAVGEFHQFGGPHVAQAVDAGRAIANVEHGTCLEYVYFFFKAQ